MLILRGSSSILRLHKLLFIFTPFQPFSEKPQGPHHQTKALWKWCSQKLGKQLIPQLPKTLYRRSPGKCMHGVCYILEEALNGKWIRATLCLICWLWNDFAGIWLNGTAATLPEQFKPAQMTLCCTTVCTIFLPAMLRKASADNQ